MCHFSEREELYPLSLSVPTDVEIKADWCACSTPATNLKNMFPV